MSIFFAILKEIYINKNERYAEITNILKRTSFATVEYLSEEIHISPSSIRRDLTMLEAQGLVRRTHGGVSLVISENLNIPFAMRMKANVSEKKAMAKKAAALVHEGDVVFLDASSTDMFVAVELVKKRGITVVSNSIAILHHLAGFHTKAICVGGALSAEDRNAIVGGDALRTLEDLRADIAFIAPQAIDKSGNLFDCYREEVEVVRKMLSCAKLKVGLCDSSKLGKVSTYKQCSIGELDALIGEINLSPFYSQKFPSVKYY